jgi:hypothetical protein
MSRVSREVTFQESWNVKADFLLAEVEVAAIEVIGETAGEAEGHGSEAVAGEGDGVVAGGGVLGRPGAGEAVGALGLLAFHDVVLFLAELAAELEGVGAADPGHILLEDVGGEFFGLVVVRVPAEDAGADAGPAQFAEGVGEAEAGGPVGEIGVGARVLRGAVDADESSLSRAGVKVLV